VLTSCSEPSTVIRKLSMAAIVSGRPAESSFSPGRDAERQDSSSGVGSIPGRWYSARLALVAQALTAVDESRKARLIEAAGRFTLMVERISPTVRYVSVEGPVTRTIPGTDELLREITERYLRPEEVPGYLEFARTELGEQVAIYLRPQRWLSADLGPG
jgi:hypothetical protein